MHEGGRSTAVRDAWDALAFGHRVAIVLLPLASYLALMGPWPAGMGYAGPGRVAAFLLLVPFLAYGRAHRSPAYTLVAPIVLAIVAFLSVGPGTGGLRAGAGVAGLLDVWGAASVALLVLVALVATIGGNATTPGVAALWIYIARRLALLVPVLVGISIITFGLAWFATNGHLETQYISQADRLSPERIDRLTKLYGFDQPGYLQYFIYVKNILKGDLGISTSFGNRPVEDVIGTLFPASVELAAVSMVLAVLLGIPLGILSATQRDRPIDHVTRFGALSGVSVPVFWLALILQLYLSYHLGRAGFDLFPLNGRFDPNLVTCAHPVVWDDLSQYAMSCGREAPGLVRTRFLLIDTLVWRDLVAFLDVLRHLILPAITLGFVTLAIIMRMMRASMLEVLGLDYVRTARAKGLEEKVVVNRHARRNALIPTMTVIGLSVGGLMGGAVLTETIFSWPGLGRWATRAILSVDVGALMGFVLLTAIIYVLANLFVDLLYAYLDPRVRLE